MVSSFKENAMLDTLGPTWLGSLAINLFGPNGHTIIAVVVICINVLAITVFIKLAEAGNHR